MFWTRAIDFVLLVKPISAILVMCPLGFASTWLVSQVEGRPLGPMCEYFAVVVAERVVVVEVVVIVEIEDAWISPFI